MVKKNENHTVTITGMNHEGQGVARINNFAVFVDGAITGETVFIKIIKVNKSYAAGELAKIIIPSPDRTPALCEAFKRCGGCSLQHMSYKAQLGFKTGVVRDSIKRIGKLEDVIINDALGMQNPLNYRNKAQYPVGLLGNKPIIGFYARRTHEIVNSTVCDIHDKTGDRVRSVVREYIVKNSVSVYDETSGKGLIRHIMARTGFKTGEVMVVIVINGEDLPRRQKLVDDLTLSIPGVKNIFLNINTKNTNIILGNRNIKIYGKETITDFIGGFAFEISPLSFFQVNPVQTEVLYDKVLEYACLTGSEVVFDLYCGIGTISLFLSGKAKKVYGVELVEDAILDARKNAALNGVTNAEFMAGEVERVIPRICEQGMKADVVVLDPPRKGCDEALLEALVNMQPERIVYVSCNPSTLARDLSYLAGNGYRTVEVQPVDMFPYTAHVECVVRIHRVED